MNNATAHHVSLAPLRVDAEYRAAQYRADCHNCEWGGGMYSSYEAARNAADTHHVRRRGRDGHRQPERACRGEDMTTASLLWTDGLRAGIVIYCDNCGVRVEAVDQAGTEALLRAHLEIA